MAYHSYTCLAGKWLASNGIKHIQLLSRSGKLEAAEETLEGLTHPGWSAAVTVAKCDVAFREDAADALGQESAKGNP